MAYPPRRVSGSRDVQYHKHDTGAAASLKPEIFNTDQGSQFTGCIHWRADQKQDRHSRGDIQFLVLLLCNDWKLSGRSHLSVLQSPVEQCFLLRVDAISQLCVGAYMLTFRFSVSLMVAAGLSGCGTYVPEIQDFPASPAQGQLLVQSIVQNVTCEVQNAVYDVINDDKNDFRTKAIPQRLTSWLDNWGVQITLNLTVDETGSVNPTVAWLPPSPVTAIFNLNAGGTLSAASTRIDKLHSFYSVPELVARRCSADSRPGGLFLMQSDLKLKEWLLDNVMEAGTGEVSYPAKPNGPFKQDVISHEVKFVVVSSGNVTPGWKLKRVSVDQSGSLLSAGRTRTHDLLITFGPMDTTALAKGIRAPSTAAQSSNLASEIGLAVTSGIRSGLAVPQ